MRSCGAKLRCSLLRPSSPLVFIFPPFLSKADASTEKLSPVQLTKQVEYLQKQLTDLHLDKLLGPNGELNLADPHGALQKFVCSSGNIFVFENKRTFVSSTAKEVLMQSAH